MVDLCSQNLISLLRHVDQHMVTLQQLRGIKDPTLWSALRRGYLGREGIGPDAIIVLTAAGTIVLSNYDSRTPPQRKAAADLTERTTALLSAARLRLHRGGKRVA